MVNFTFILNPDDKKPLYEQLYAYIAEEIKQKRLSEHERLPSKKLLSAHLAVSQNTVETAYAMLVQEGYIRSVPRSGYYVCRVDMPIGTASIPVSEQTVQPQEIYQYDFKTNAVDLASFPYATWAKLSKDVLYHSPELLSVGEAKGDIALRETIAKYLHEFRGVRCSPEQVIIGAGIEYLLMLVSAFMGERHIVAAENPGYRKTVRIFHNSGMQIHYVALDAYGMRMDGLEDATIAYITPSHQFPTGITMPIGRRMELLNWAYDGEDRYLIEDDYNGEFHFAGKSIPAVQGMDTRGKVIYLSTFSRILAPSIRIAYMVLPYPLLAAYEKRFGAYSSTVSRFEQQTLNRFITDGYLARHLNRVKVIYRKRRDAVISAVKESKKNIRITGERAGLHLLMHTPEAKQMIAYAKKQSIRLYSLDDYYFGKKPETDTIIAGYGGLNTEEIQTALGRVL